MFGLLMIGGKGMVRGAHPTLALWGLGMGFGEFFVSGQGPLTKKPLVPFPKTISHDR
jgi:hypothetical protein